jgi:hypothetical protein
MGKEDGEQGKEGRGSGEGMRRSFEMNGFYV